MKTIQRILSVVALCSVFSINTIAEGGAEENWSLTPIEVKTVAALQALVMKADVNMADISVAMGEIYQSVFAYLGELGKQPAGPPISVYYEFDPKGQVVFEAGVPVAEAMVSKNDILFKEYPEMKVVTAMYTGSYHDMEPAYAQIMGYMEELQLESTGVSWEVYLTDPNEVSPEENQTIIYFPIKE